MKMYKFVAFIVFECLLVVAGILSMFAGEVIIAVIVFAGMIVIAVFVFKIRRRRKPPKPRKP